MSTLLRTWTGLAAIGAGCVHLAVAAGASSAAALLGFVLLGALELAWAVAALARDSLPLPRPALGGAAVAVVVGLGVLLGPSLGGHHHGTEAASAASAPSLPALPLLGATVLDLAVAALIAAALRRGPRRTEAFPPVWGYLAGVIGGAGLVGALTSASLAGTAVGALALHAGHAGH